MIRTLILLLITSASCMAQTWRGHTSGYIYINFNGAGNGSRETYTTAYGTNGTSWVNTGGKWDGMWQQANAIEAIYRPSDGKFYAFNACTANGRSNCTAIQVGLLNETSGYVTPLTMFDWKASGALPSLNSCFQPGVARNADGTPIIDVNGIHLMIPCSTSGITNFTLYETHSTDMVTWSSPVSISGPATNDYDEKVWKIGSTYYMWLCGAQNYVELWSSSSLTGPYTSIHTGDWNGWGNHKEGPFMYAAPSGSGYVYYLQFEEWVDDSGCVGCNPVIYYSKCDNADPTVCTWTAKTAYTTDYPIRHGTVIKFP